MTLPISREAALIVNRTPSNIFRYIEFNRTDVCPLCDNKAGYYDKEEVIFKIKFCTAFKRAVIKGFWWWRVYCPLNGVHYHARCPKCKCNWIVIKEYANNRQIHDVELLEPVLPEEFK